MEAYPFTVGLIRVITLEREEDRDCHGRLIMEYFPELRVISRCIPDQPEGVHSPETEALAAPKIVALAKELREEGADMILVSCAADPAVEDIRTLGIPAMGAGECTAAVAGRYGKRVAVLGITPDAPSAFERLLGEGLIDASMPDGIRSTLDLQTPEGRQSAVDKAAWQKAQGAQVIALACTGMATIGLAPVLEKELGLPVIDPVLCEGLFAKLEMLRRDLYR
ncbi:aspartate/glutamate racemase family protein [Zongyangia hominis]|uniref:Aspartate/glutamate racemase family protein n=1 Tax=Zongyangia hominis TaxID=2763677 RepID=A0A926EFA2_9FIRM|nr:aspartate/glutamate racemase family protein [Zongyangia hominis]MBC8571104.1 aspartate/glutamate racemase family protein [Zongyangia hominis]